MKKLTALALGAPAARKTRRVRALEAEVASLSGVLNDVSVKLERARVLLLAARYWFTAEVVPARAIREKIIARIDAVTTDQKASAASVPQAAPEVP